MERKYERRSARCSQPCTAGVGKQRQCEVYNLLMPGQARHMHLALLTVGKTEAQMFLLSLVAAFFFSPCQSVPMFLKNVCTLAKHSLHYFILPSLPVPAITDTKSRDTAASIPCWINLARTNFFFIPTKRSSCFQVHDACHIAFQE